MRRYTIVKMYSKEWKRHEKHKKDHWRLLIIQFFYQNTLINLIFNLWALVGVALEALVGNKCVSSWSLRIIFYVCLSVCLVLSLQQRWKNLWFFARNEIWYDIIGLRLGFFGTQLCKGSMTMSFVCPTREGVWGWMVHFPGSLINNKQGGHILIYLVYCEYWVFSSGRNRCQ